MKLETSYARMLAGATLLAAAAAAAAAATASAGAEARQASVSTMENDAYRMHVAAAERPQQASGVTS